MDLCAVQRSAICIPTPGQTEQEYLARIHSTRRNIVFQAQNQMNLDKALSMAADLTPFQLPVNEGIKPLVGSLIQGLK
jgi:hypothetical protein